MLTEPGDWVVVESPPSTAPQAIERLKLKVVEIPVIPGWASIRPAGRRPCPAPRQGVLADGQCPAPLGHTMPDEHKQALMALLNRHQVPLVEDDVYAGALCRA